jgi:tetratricopeptide (TPR) repeat protein
VGRRRAPRRPPEGPAIPARAPSAGGGTPVLLLVAVAAFGLKALVAAQLVDHPLLQPRGVLDDAAYVRLAERVASGDVTLGPDVYYLAPLYTYVLGALFAAGGSLVAARMLQITLGSVAVALVGLTARRWFGPAAALPAAIAAALTGLFTFNEILILQSSLDPFLTALALFALARALERRSIGSCVAAGLASGALALNRPNALLAAVAVAVAWVGARRSRVGLREVSAYALGVALLVAPVTIRNRVVAGEWVLLTSHGGLNFYIGNRAGADGTWMGIPGIAPDIEGQARDARRVASQALGRPAGARETSAYFYGLAWQWIRTHPGEALVLFLRKVALTFGTTDVALNYSYTYYAHDERTLLSALVVGPWLLVPVGVVGLWLGLRLRPGAAYRIWLVFVPAYAVSVAAFFMSSRYRLPLLVPLAIGAGATLAWCWERARGREWGRLLGPVSGAAALGVAVSLPLAADVGRMYERGERIVFDLAAGRDAAALARLDETLARHPEPGLLLFRVGRVFQDRGDATRAVEWFEKALAADPGQPDIRFSLGQALLAAGRPGEAVAHLAAARAAAVESDLATAELVLAYAALGRREEARRELAALSPSRLSSPALAVALGRAAVDIEAFDLAEPHLRRALAGAPDDVEILELLGIALDRLGRHDEAAATLTRLVALAPSRASGHYFLALALAQLGRLDDARRQVGEARRLDPGLPGARRLEAELARLAGR